MEKKYQVVCYIRIEPEEVEPQTYRDALLEKRNQEFMQPENIYRVEEIDSSE
jgi:hypothetical protein